MFGGAILGKKLEKDSLQIKTGAKKRARKKKD